MAAMTKIDKLSILLGILLFDFLTYPFMHIFNRVFPLSGNPSFGSVSVRHLDMGYCGPICLGALVQR